jgi:hypothetical protein
MGIIWCWMKNGGVKDGGGVERDMEVGEYER